ncbi:MAG: DUF4129 domain-containing protein [Desulfobacterales bacterium]
MSRPGGARLAAMFAAGIELSWMSLALRLTESWPVFAGIPPAWVLGGLPLAFALRTVTGRLRPRLSVAAAGAGGLLWAAGAARLFLAATAGGPPPGEALPNPGWAAGLVAAAAIGIWGAGLRLAGFRPGPGHLLAEFQLGVLVLLAVFLLAAPERRPLPGAEASVAALFLCFFLGAALLQGRQAGLSRPQVGSSSWAAFAAGNGVLILAAGVLLAVAARPEWVQAGIDAASRAASAAAGWFRALIAWLDSLLPRPEPSPLRGVVGAAPVDRPPPAVIELFRFPETLRRVAAFLVVSFWLALFALCLWRLTAEVTHRLLRGPRGGPEENGERLPFSLREALRRLLSRAGRFLERTARRLGFLRGRGRPAADAAPSAAIVRRIYRELLDRAAACGLPREPAQTPREFLARLRPRATDSLAASFERITAQYEAVRYGETPPDEEAARRLASEWRLVRKFHLAARG